ncbi:hypothetical protein K438DRAFT_1757401 [Mycena galopus ATCC 62051]|nr:hypothetical protein K438DRAFT_1757401 [Mycena galopus ATCC 62051]
MFWLWLWLFGLALASENLKPGQAKFLALAWLWLGLAWGHGFWQGNQCGFGFSLMNSQAKPKPTRAKARESQSQAKKPWLFGLRPKPEHHYALPSPGPQKQPPLAEEALAHPDVEGVLGRSQWFTAATLSAHPSFQRAPDLKVLQRDLDALGRALECAPPHTAGAVAAAGLGSLHASLRSTSNRGIFRTIRYRGDINLDNDSMSRIVKKFVDHGPIEQKVDESAISDPELTESAGANYSLLISQFAGVDTIAISDSPWQNDYPPLKG